jgi:hypothetical protein
MRSNVAVLGAGSWGTTLASMCARHGPTTIWALEDEVAREINARHTNSLYLQGFELTPALRATRRVEEATEGAKVVVLAVPSPYFRAVLGQAAPFVPKTVPVVSVAKGLEPETLLRMTEVIAQVLPDNPRAALSGPNLAREIIAGYAAGAVVACHDAEVARHLQGVFNSGLYRVYTTHDVVGVEAAGALKNVIAIAAGMADGVGVGDNTPCARHHSRPRGGSLDSGWPWVESRVRSPGSLGSETSLPRASARSAEIDTSESSSERTASSRTSSGRCAWSPKAFTRAGWSSRSRDVTRRDADRAGDRPSRARRGDPSGRLTLERPRRIAAKVEWHPGELPCRASASS